MSWKRCSGKRPWVTRWLLRQQQEEVVVKEVLNKGEAVDLVLELLEQEEVAHHQDIQITEVPIQEILEQEEVAPHQDTPITEDLNQDQEDQVDQADPAIQAWDQVQVVQVKIQADQDQEDQEDQVQADQAIQAWDQVQEVQAAQVDQEHRVVKATYSEIQTLLEENDTDILYLI